MVARLLWEQDAAGSNPVSPMRSETSPQLVFKPSRKGRFFYCSPCSSKLLEGASHSAVAPEIPRSPLSSRSQTWTPALSTESTLPWSPTSLQGSELKFRLLSHPRICNKLNYLSQFAWSGLILLPICWISRDQEHERNQDQTHHRSRGLRVLQGLRPRRCLPSRQRHVGSTAPHRRHP